MKIRNYNKNDEKNWLRCRVLAFFDTAYHDNVIQEKESYLNDSIELICEHNGLIVGLIDIKIIDDTKQKFGMIWHLAVHPDYQKQGIATLLLKHAVSESETILQTTIPQLTPAYTFFHYTGIDPTIIGIKFERIHRCTRFDLLLSKEEIYG